jgi:hypothetical protein
MSALESVCFSDGAIQRQLRDGARDSLPA